MSDNIIKTDRLYIRKLMPTRVKDSNKGTYGTVLNIAGSIYYPGAAALSSAAALKAGAGAVRLACETSIISSVAAKFPDVTFIDLGQNEYGCIPKDGLKYIKNLKNPSAISIGCGLTTFAPAKEFLLKFLESYINSTIPIIIDADAINIMASVSKPLIPLNSVITPHPLELARLLNTDVELIKADKVQYAKAASSEFDCIVVLKGAETVISIPNGNTFINPTGNSALSHAGTGDILTGMIAGFASQGVKLEDACVLAVYLHGLAGEFASFKLSEYSALASDILNFIPNAIKEFV